MRFVPCNRLTENINFAFGGKLDRVCSSRDFDSPLPYRIKRTRRIIFDILLAGDAVFVNRIS